MAMTNYLADLRAVVGHRLLLLPSVSVVPVDADGRLLLRRHADFQAWGLIGGTMELDESPVAGVHRKAADVGITVTDPRLVGVFGGPEFHLSYPSGDEAAVVGSLFEARLVGPPSDAVAWFFRHELPALNMVSLTRAILADQGFLAGGGGSPTQVPR